jgi:FG-GAP-like repeat/Bacterial Ig domain
MKHFRLFLTLLVVVLSTRLLFAQDFEHRTFSAGPNQQVNVADVNGDGWPDLIVSINNNFGTAHGFSVMLNQGNGNFGAPVVISTTALNTLRVGDFNNDGKIDISRCNGQGVAIFLGDGHAHFTKVSTTPANCDFAVGDFNHDGRMDFASKEPVTSSTGRLLSTSIVVHLGDGTGGFSGTVTTGGLGAATDTALASPLVALVSGDLNRDGFSDLAVSEACGDASSACGDAHAGVLMNDGTAHFTYKRVFTSVINVDQISIVDLNQDGWLDLLINSQEEEPFIRPLTALLRQPDGSYLQEQIYNRPLESGNSFGFTSPAFGDWDGDGVKDLAFGESTAPEGSDTTFQWLRILYPADNSYTSLKNNVGIVVDSVGPTVSADFDRDGRPDIAYLGRGNIELYLNRTASAPLCSTATTPLRTVKLCAPAEGATVTSPTRILANVSTGMPLSSVKIYIDGVSKFITYDNLVNKFFTLAPGSHKVTVKAWDVIGSFSESNLFTVSGTTSGCTASTTNRTVKICTPANGSAVTSPVHLQVQVTDSSGVTVKVYVDGVAKLTTTNKSIDMSTSLAAGSHKITVRAWDASGNYSSTTTFTVQ